MASILFLYIISSCYVSFYLFRAHFVLFLREQLVHRLQMQRQHLQPLRVVPPLNLLQNVHWYANLAPKRSLLDAMSVNVIKYRYELHTVTCL